MEGPAVLFTGGVDSLFEDASTILDVVRPGLVVTTGRRGSRNRRGREYWNRSADQHAMAWCRAHGVPMLAAPTLPRTGGKDAFGLAFEARTRWLLGTLAKQLSIEHLLIGEGPIGRDWSVVQVAKAAEAAGLAVMGLGPRAAGVARTPESVRVESGAGVG